MDWGEIVLNVLGVGATAASGGVFGLIASGLGAWFKRKQLNDEREFEKAKWAHADNQFKLQMEMDRQEDAHELAITAQQGSWEGLKASYGAVRKPTRSYAWVDAIKDLYRPVLTTLLIVCTMYIFFRLMGVLEGNESTLATVIGKTEAIDLMLYIIYSVVFSTSTAVVWWFGDRAFAPPGMKNR